VVYPVEEGVVVGWGVGFESQAGDDGVECTDDF